MIDGFLVIALPAGIFGGIIAVPVAGIIGHFRGVSDRGRLGFLLGFAGGFLSAPTLSFWYEMTHAHVKHKGSYGPWWAILVSGILGGTVAGIIGRKRAKPRPPAASGEEMLADYERSVQSGPAPSAGTDAISPPR